MPTFSSLTVSDLNYLIENYHNYTQHNVFQAEGGLDDRNAGPEGFHPHQSRDHRAVRVYIRRGDAPERT